MSRPRLGRRVFTASVVVLALAGCGGSNSGSSGAPPPPPPPSAANVMAVSINPLSPAAVCDTVNELCASVTICQPNTSNCQTISDVLVDTGAYGLRLFASVVTVPLTTPTSHNAPIGECTFFAGLTVWGNVQIADVKLAGEPVVQVPIQLINATFANQYTSGGAPVQGGNRCNVAGVEFSPADSGLNGILGVGLFKNDGQSYYECTGNSCIPVPGGLPAAQQVQNPVALLPVDNNGVVVQLPAVGPNGASSISGSLIFGIGTQSNNQPSGVMVYPVNNCGDFITVYKGTTFQSGPGCSGGAFLDTGSNALFFPDPSIPNCPAFFYCPNPSPLSLSATTSGASGTPSSVVNFQIANANSLFATGNAVFNNLGASVPGLTVFDWGIPFFLGRTVFVGISGQNSVLGPGPYWAY